MPKIDLHFNKQAQTAFLPAQSYSKKSSNTQKNKKNDLK